jgi:hypothetical protein
MDCDFCQIRSNVGFCVECHKLLCEECGKTCAECRKTVCPDHAETTRRGRVLCPACMEERRRKREEGERRKEGEAAESNSFENLDDSASRAKKTLEEEPEEDRILTVSGYRARAPWARSFRSLVPAVAGMAVGLRYPVFRSIVQPWLSGIMILFCVIAALWALHGLRSESLRGHRALNLIGLALALLLLVGAVYTL